MKINVLIKPNSKKGPQIIAENDGSLTVFIRELAIEGKANQATIKLVAKYYNVSKTSVKILRGQTSRHKLIEIEGI